MKSTGFTNTSNEATELIRLQREALEDKLKTDKIKAIAETGSQMVPFNNGGSNDLRGEFQKLHKQVNYMMLMPGTFLMPSHGTVGENKNAGFYDGPRVEEIGSKKAATFAGDEESEEEILLNSMPEQPEQPEQPEPPETPKKIKDPIGSFIRKFTQPKK